MLLVLLVKTIIGKKPSGCHRSEAKSKPVYRGPYNSTIKFTVGKNADHAFMYLPFSKRKHCLRNNVKVPFLSNMNTGVRALQEKKTTLVKTA